MTKDYHITPEQTLELAKELDKSGANIAVSPDGDVEVFGSKGLQQLINAAIDKVLGS